MKETCSPLYATIMEEKKALLEQQRIYASQQQQYGYEERRGEQQQQQLPLRPSTYQPLGLNDDLLVEINPDDKPGKCAWKVVVVPMAIFLLIVHAMESGWFADFFASTQSHLKIPHFFSTQHEPADIRHLWGQYSPYFDQRSSVPAEVPSDCEVTFLQVLARHGSRFPTSSKSLKYTTMLERVLPKIPEDAFVGPYKFLANYSYDLGSDVLTALGRMEMANLALDVHAQYSALLRDDETAIPFVRASGSPRVVESGKIFAQMLKLKGLDDLPPLTDPDSVADIPVLVLPEAPGFNNTLDRHLCANVHKEPYSMISKHAKATFTDHFILPVADRLNSDLRLSGDDKLGLKETIYLLDLCAFESVAFLHPFPPSNRTSSGSGLSPICNLFTDADFRAYNYSQSLDKYYGYGHGNPLAPSTGIGFVNELIARLTGKPVRDSTSTNRTLDSDPQTFPVGELEGGKLARVFADFSHDNTIVAIHASLRLFEDTPLLPTTAILDQEEMAGFGAASTVPFSSRTFVEKLQCKGRDEEDVRIIVNSKVMPLRSCGGDKHGRCSLSRFVESLDFARSGGRWDLCFDA